MRIGSILLVVWLLIGVLAAVHRGYLQGDDEVDCATASTIVVTIIAGPLNYAGVNPKVEACEAPQPSP